MDKKDLIEKVPLVKVPVVLDTRGNQKNSNAIQTLLDANEAQRLMTVASELGEFSVRIVAYEGDPYKTIYEIGEHEVITSEITQVPEGKVIISAQNTSDPNNLTELSRLWRAVEAK